MSAIFRFLSLVVLCLAVLFSAQHRLAAPGQPGQRIALMQAALAGAERNGPAERSSGQLKAAQTSVDLSMAAAVTQPGQAPLTPALAVPAPGSAAKADAAAWSERRGHAIGLRPCRTGQGPDLHCPGDLLLPQRPGLPQPLRQAGLWPPASGHVAADLPRAPGLRPPRPAPGTSPGLASKLA